MEDSVSLRNLLSQLNLCIYEPKNTMILSVNENVELRNCPISIQLKIKNITFLKNFNGYK